MSNNHSFVSRFYTNLQNKVKRILKRVIIAYIICENVYNNNSMNITTAIFVCTSYFI